MSKRLSGDDRNPTAVQADVSPNVYKDSADQIVEMAAEQLADLLWRHWLYMQKLKKKGSIESDS